MGGSFFCLKACDPNGPDAAKLCQHIYDRIGCAYNAPTNVKNGTFEACKGENQDFPGIYTSNGQVMTYTQPPESLGPITTMPYTARIPASSECVTYTSSVLYSALHTISAPGQPPAATGTPKSGKTGNSESKPPGGNGGSSDASSLAVGGLATILGVAFSALFLA
jgi:hypothetical protein